MTDRASSEDAKWIVIPNWERFQHYVGRDPIWLKDYVSQLDDDDYLRPSLSQRGMLSGIRLLYAASDGQLPFDVLRITHRLGSRVTEQQLEALRRAGLIQVVASRPLSLARARERSREKSSEEKTERASAQEQNPPSQKTGRASTSEPNPPSRRRARDNGGWETPDPLVKAEMIRLATGWLEGQGVEHVPAPVPKPGPDDDNPFLG
jgi:hypothetical protein